MAQSVEQEPAAYVEQANWQPRHNPWAVALTVTLATFMEVLDTSIANVALPHIAGSMAATQDESTWVLTSYLVSNAVVLPVSAWLSMLLGRKRFYMTCVAIFSVSSFLCGLAPSLGMLIFFRILQGAGGGGLAPSEQAILADTFPPKKLGLAFSVYGMAVVVAPAIGPILGGWLTDNFSWRWIFYINVPVGIISLLLTQRLVEDPPYFAKNRAKARGLPLDWTGLGLVTLAVCCLQIVLDKGQEADWFSSHWIFLLTVVSVASFAVWIIWEWNHPSPIVELKLFKRVNYAAAMFIMFVLGAVLYGTTVMIPQFVQTLLGYSATQAGETLAGGGAIMLVMMPIAGYLVSRLDPRRMMSIGFASTALALFYMTDHLTLGMGFATAAVLRVFQTLGLSFVFIPSSTLVYASVPPDKNNQVSAMNNFLRNVGGSIGISLFATFLARQTQKHQNFLVANATPGAPAFETMLRGMAALFHAQGLSAAEATHRAYATIMLMIQAQAANLAYVDVVSVFALLILCLTPIPFLMRRNRASSPPPAGMH